MKYISYGALLLIFQSVLIKTLKLSVALDVTDLILFMLFVFGSPSFNTVQVREILCSVLHHPKINLWVGFGLF